MYDSNDTVSFVRAVIEGSFYEPGDSVPGYNLRNVEDGTLIGGVDEGDISQVVARKFLIWTRGYPGESRVAVTFDGTSPRLEMGETIAHEIKSCASDNPLRPGERAPFDTSRDNS